MQYALLATFFACGCDCGAEPPCFQGDPTLAEIQSQIFDRSCNKFESCHNSGAGVSVGGLDLCGPDSPGPFCDDDKTSVRDRLVDVPAGCTVGSRSCEDPACVPEDADAGPPTFRVVPGDPNASYLYRRVSGEGLGDDCVRKMPYGATDGLCKEGVDAIRTWIENGALP